MPQCFCRLCAVFGGIYCLGRPVADIAISEEANKVQLKVGEHKVSTKFLLQGFGGKVESENYLSRGVLVTWMVAELCS